MAVHHGVLGVRSQHEASEEPVTWRAMLAKTEEIAREGKYAGSERFLELYELAKLLWTQSDCRRTFKARFTARCPQSGWHVNKAVLMALGNPNEFRLRVRIGVPARSVMQLVVFLDIVGILHSDDPRQKPIKLYAQDPAFRRHNKMILQEVFGMTVLEEPEAEKLIDDSTFVMTPFLPWEHMIYAPRDNDGQLFEQRLPAIGVGGSFAQLHKDSLSVLLQARHQITKVEEDESEDDESELYESEDEESVWEEDKWMEEDLPVLETDTKLVGRAWQRYDEVGKVCECTRYADEAEEAKEEQCEFVGFRFFMSHLWVNVKKSR